MTTVQSNQSVPQVSNTGIKKEVSVSEITLDKIFKNDYQKKGTLTAQIRQLVTTVSHYPAIRVSSSLQETLFSTEDFGEAAEGQVFTSEEKRVAWILVPESITKEQVEKKLEAANKNKASIYRVLSNRPILDENQEYAIRAGLRTMDDFADAQVVRYGKDDDQGREGQLNLDPRGEVQYRRTFFWGSPKEDIDVRGTVEPYISEEMRKEIEGAMAMRGQTI